MTWDNACWTTGCFHWEKQSSTMSGQITEGRRAAKVNPEKNKIK